MENKKCRDCLNTLPLKFFGRDKNKKDGIQPRCKPCKARRERLYRRTIIGKIKNTYLSMKRRVENRIDYKNHRIYKGKELLNKESFIQWSLQDKDFHVLFKEWEKSGYCNLINPSIDRIDNAGGYTINNIRWVTMVENCRNQGIKK